MQPAASDCSDLFDKLGQSEQPFHDLVFAFYANVEADSALRSLYPDDLADAKQHLIWFLIQRFGGPPLFNEKRGAPMLRRRHVEFAITPNMAERWFNAMSAAVNSVPEFQPYSEIVLRYFEDAAVFLINRQEPMTVEFDASGRPGKS